jgi:Glycosyl hydrolase family 20, catalytic domain
MKKNRTIFLALFLLAFPLVQYGQLSPEAVFPVKGFCIRAPGADGIDRFTKFIDEELASRGVNTLILIMGYNYEYESYPQLRDSAALSKKEVKKIVAVCRKNNIRIIPQINLLGHQSSRNHLNKLLEKFPQFDETPDIKMPEKYEWPNPDNLYCKSYCPLHPDVHKVIFAVVDELCDAFETDAFHAGMDEIFYLGDDKCPRCKGVDKAELFAGEVTLIRNHLALKNRELWIWGDRLINGKSTGLGFWEASYNYTWPAIDMIPKDVVICDWHYERPDQTAIYFAMNGFRVITCPWRTPPTAVIQAEDMAKFRKYATPEMKPLYYGMMQTTWMVSDGFIDGFNGIKSENAMRAVHPGNPDYTPWDTFRAMYKRMDELEKEAK